MMQKKAQVTVFIIIGIIILIGAGLYAYIRFSLQEEEVTGEEEQTEVAFRSTSELAEYVYACIEPKTLQGLEIMRLQGGRIDTSGVRVLEAMDLDDGRRVMDTETGKIVTSAEGPNRIAYWVDEEGASIPSLEAMEQELADYILENSRRCIGDLEPFRNQGYDIEMGEMKINVVMEKAVVVNVSLPVTMSRGEEEIREDIYLFTVPVNMEMIHTIASNIAAAEMTNTYLEQHTMNWISIYGRVNGQIPPLVASVNNLDCSQSTWTYDQTLSSLREIFDTNVDLFRIRGTDYERVIKDTDTKQSMVDSQTISVFSPDTYPNVRVDHDYRPGWDTELSMDPASLAPDVISTTGIPFLPMFCYVRYRFKYTIQYPVLLRITDYQSAKIDPIRNYYDKSRGFTFYMPMRVVIYGNAPRQPVELDVTSPKEQEIRQMVGIIGEETGKILLDPSPFCDQENMLSREATISTYDAETGEPLKGVMVKYYCGSYVNDCYMGRTEKVNSTADYTSRFPLCVNGELRLTKQGYNEKRITWSSYDIQDTSIKVKMDPEKTFDIEVRKVYWTTFKDQFQGDIHPLSRKLTDREMATIKISGDDDMAVIYPQQKNITIAPGKYQVDIMLFGNVSIAPTEYTVEAAGETYTAEIDPYDGKHYKGSFPIGMVENINWGITTGDMKSEKVIFYVFADYNPGRLSLWTDLMNVDEEEVFSHQEEQEYLTPRFE
ncbi:hypothetical protein GF351_00815 [Candidatus Woesearchaeota archaeon]|nr:hypothetical protein [Candidatus Woesearchaeota archaeon]